MVKITETSITSRLLTFPVIGDPLSLLIILFRLNHMCYMCLSELDYSIMYFIYWTLDKNS